MLTQQTDGRERTTSARTGRRDLLIVLPSLFNVVRCVAQPQSTDGVAHRSPWSRTAADYGGRSEEEQARCDSFAEAHLSKCEQSGD